ncbi:MAG: peptidase U32 [Firmicutes bacterium HGW-Firmicutes-1]|jgi:putative protease|nr:MAG: peptidase U32 [Firmicutes bacterium HGW-Firmicutes-1]
MNYNKPELLSPAGSYQALTAAIHAGCDAVYLGGEKFGARANAENFTNDTLPKAIDFAHLHGVKVYYTANTLIKENEMQTFLEQVNFLYQEGIDALIIQDIGVYQTVHRYFPRLALHGSTQMTIHSLEGAIFLENLGFERVVLSRELSLQEINYIINNSKIEIECFIHGALCYSYSGQCLFSSLIGGRSGNRGTCAQPCRLPYELYNGGKLQNTPNNKFLLSPKDIQTLEIIPQLIKSGIGSFKIEGRMKNANYVALITSIYRKYIDSFLSNPEKYHVDQQDILDVHQIFNRGGFSSGYFLNKNGIDMISITRPNHQGIKIGKVDKIMNNKSFTLSLEDKVNQGDCLEITTSNADNYSFIAKENILTSPYTLNVDVQGIRQGAPVYKLTDVHLAKRIQEELLEKDKKIPVKVMFTAKVGEPCQLTMSYKQHIAKVWGVIVEQAITSVMSADKIAAQLNKTGNDPIYMNELNLTIDENIFLSIKELNALRREAIEILINEILQSTKRVATIAKYNTKKNVNPINTVNINVLIRSMAQYQIVKGYAVSNLYLELSQFSINEIKKISEECNELAIKVYIALPKIIRKENSKQIKDSLNLIKKLPIQGMMIRTLDSYELVKGIGEILLDYSANIFNNAAFEFWNQHSIKRFCISPELNLKEISLLGNNELEIVIYGYIPLMVTAQCLNKTMNKPCNNEDIVYELKDRKNIIFKVFKDCKMCLNTIYNSLPVVLIDKYKDLKAIGIGHLRLEFLDESPSDIREIMNYSIGILNNQNMSTEDYDKINALKNYTRGHLTRGVK